MRRCCLCRAQPELKMSLIGGAATCPNCGGIYTKNFQGKWVVLTGEKEGHGEQRGEAQGHGQDGANELLKANPQALNNLLSYRVEVGKSVIDHPDVVVAVPKGDYTGHLGLLGVLNGILKRAGALKVAMQVDEAGCVVGFCRYGIDGG